MFKLTNCNNYSNSHYLRQQMGIFEHEHIKGWMGYSSEITRQAPLLPAKDWKIKLQQPHEQKQMSEDRKNTALSD